MHLKSESNSIVHNLDFNNQTQINNLNYCLTEFQAQKKPAVFTTAGFRLSGQLDTNGSGI